MTKSGTNLWSGSAFEFFRDKSMNALTETENPRRPASARAVKGDYRQNQFGGSFGGPIREGPGALLRGDRADEPGQDPGGQHPGAVPDQDGVFAVPYRETPFSGKVTANLNANQFLSVRYGRDTNSQPHSAAPNSTFDNWGDSTNKYNSINLNHNWVMSGSKLNEFIFQYADFGNTIASRSSASRTRASRTA